MQRADRFGVGFLCSRSVADPDPESGRSEHALCMAARVAVGDAATLLDPSPPSVRVSSTCFNRGGEAVSAK